MHLKFPAHCTQWLFVFSAVSFLAFGLAFAPHSVSAQDDAATEAATPADADTEVANTEVTDTDEAPPIEEATPAEDNTPDTTAAASAVAAEEASTESPAAAANGSAMAEWKTVFGEWKGLLTELRDLTTKYQLAEPSELEGLQQQWAAKVEEGNQKIPHIREVALAAHAEAPNSDRELTNFLVKMLADEVGDDNFEVANELGKSLVESKVDDRKVLDLAGTAAYAMNEFERAKQLLEEAESSGSISETGRNFLGNIQQHPNLAELWVAEQKVREAEVEAAEGQELPRVKMETTSGDFVIELFENEAPETVGNFISLVESGYYDELNFHRVMSGFMAQGGCPNGDGMGGPGYKIYCECIADNHRNHWRGSVSMAKTAARNTGGSQFFFNFVATPHLNGQHTVFGRIVEGMENLTLILKHDPQKPNEPSTKIVKAEVIRKRDHDYVPNKVQ